MALKIGYKAEKPPLNRSLVTDSRVTTPRRSSNCRQTAVIRVAGGTIGNILDNRDQRPPDSGTITGRPGFLARSVVRRRLLVFLSRNALKGLNVSFVTSPDQTRSHSAFNDS